MSRLVETFRIGGLDVAALSDGAPDRALGSFFASPTASEWTKWLGLESPDHPVPFNFGTFLVRGEGRTVLIDSGYGRAGTETGAPGGGQLLDRLHDIGVDADEVDTIVHTHLHADHCGWDVDTDRGDARTFPNAMAWVAQAEVDHWIAREQSDNPAAQTARRAIARLRADERLTTFDGEFSVTPTLTMIPTPGHTPGHCAVMLASAGEHLLITGDAAHHPEQLVHHELTPRVDGDPQASIRSRAKLAELAAERGALVTGGHWPILTLGTVARTEGGYLWQPRQSAY